MAHLAAVAPKPADRADQIIMEGDRKRVAYRKLNPTADSAMAFWSAVAVAAL